MVAVIAFGFAAIALAVAAAIGYHFVQTGFVVDLAIINGFGGIVELFDRTNRLK